MSLVTEARENYGKKLQEAEESVSKDTAEKQTIIPNAPNAPNTPETKL